MVEKPSMRVFGMVRLDLQDLAIDLLGGAPLAGLMMLESEGESFGNGGHQMRSV